MVEHGLVEIGVFARAEGRYLFKSGVNASDAHARLALVFSLPVVILHSSLRLRVSRSVRKGYRSSGFNDRIGIFLSASCSRCANAASNSPHPDCVGR